MVLNILDTRRSRLELAGLKRTPSNSSLSTRIGSSSTLAEMDQPTTGEVGQVSDDTVSNVSSLRTPQSWFTMRTLRKAFPVIVAIIAAALWQRYAARRAQSSKRFGLKSSAAGVLALLNVWMRTIGLKGGASDFVEHPERVPQRQAVYGIHPHGAYIQGIGPNLLKELRGGASDAPTRPDIHILCADAVFQVPVFREICLMLGMRAASNRVVDRLLTEGSSVALAPGGIYEQTKTDPGREQLFFPPKLGFIRTAMKHGIPLVPLYNFGENQLYSVPSWSSKMSQKLKKATGAGFCLGIGRWGLPMMMPFPQKVHTRLGRTIEVGSPNANPTDAQVEQLFKEYCAELLRMFELHKSSLPADVAAKGLSITWRGHESVDLSAAALLRESSSIQESKASAHGNRRLVVAICRSRL